jgi:hypothetical protein
MNIHPLYSSASRANWQKAQIRVLFSVFLGRYAGSPEKALNIYSFLLEKVLTNRVGRGMLPTFRGSPPRRE